MISLVRVLNHNQGELLIGRNHNLMLQRTNSNESDGLLFMDLLNLGLSSVEEATNYLAVLDGLGRAHGASNSQSLVVDNDDTDNAHMGVNAIHRLFNFRRHHY